MSCSVDEDELRAALTALPAPKIPSVKVVGVVHAGRYRSLADLDAIKRRIATDRFAA